MNILCIVDRNHERFVVLPDHFKNFKGIYCGYIIENNGILIQGKEIIVLFEIKKRWTKVRRGISRQNQSSASLNLRKYILIKTEKLAITTPIFENK